MLVQKGVPISLRTVRNLLNRYRFLKDRSIEDDHSLMECLILQGYVVLDVIRIQGDARGFPNFFLVRDFLSGQILRARYIHRNENCDVTDVITGVCDALPVPIRALVSDHPTLLREAIPVVRPYSSELPDNSHYIRWSIGSSHDFSEFELCSTLLTKIVSDATAGGNAG